MSIITSSLQDTKQQALDKVVITLTTPVLHTEFKKQNIYPFCEFAIGPHTIKITAREVNKKRLELEYMGLVWLWLNLANEHRTMESEASYLSVQKFVALTYGLKMFHTYTGTLKETNKDTIKEDIKNNKVFALKNFQTKLDSPADADEIVNTLQKFQENEVEISTDLFGTMQVPTAQEINKFYKQFRWVD